MKTFTAVQPTQPLLPHDLALLLAPVRIEAPPAPDAYVGHAEGVILDDEGCVTAFILRIANEPHDRARTLIPVSAVSVTHGPVVHLGWTEEQLRAHPRLDAVGVEPLLDSQRRPTQPAALSHSEETSGSEVTKAGIEGTAIGAALGAVTGLAIGGPIAAAAYALFFAVGGALTGIVTGASEDDPPEPVEVAPVVAPQPDPMTRAWLRALELRLQDPGLKTVGLVVSTSFAVHDGASSTPARRSA